MRTFRVLVLAALAAGGLRRSHWRRERAATAPAAASEVRQVLQGGRRDLSPRYRRRHRLKGADAAKLASTPCGRRPSRRASNVDSALLTMADYFEAVIGGAENNPEKVSAALGEERSPSTARRSSTFTTYYVTNCSTISS